MNKLEAIDVRRFIKNNNDGSAETTDELIHSRVHAITCVWNVPGKCHHQFIFVCPTIEFPTIERKCVLSPIHVDFHPRNRHLSWKFHGETHWMDSQDKKSHRKKIHLHPMKWKRWICNERKKTVHIDSIECKCTQNINYLIYWPNNEALTRQSCFPNWLATRFFNFNRTSALRCPLAATLLLSLVFPLSNNRTKKFVCFFFCKWKLNFHGFQCRKTDFQRWFYRSPDFPFFRLKLFKCDHTNFMSAPTLWHNFCRFPWFSTPFETHKHFSLFRALGLPISLFLSLFLVLYFFLALPPRPSPPECAVHFNCKKIFIRNSPLVTSHNLSESRYANVVRWCIHWMSRCSSSALWALSRHCRQWLRVQWMEQQNDAAAIYGNAK